ncbi:uncharacterized protein FA14DRAFT_20646 [Meira miltonrushii]|uniref:UspA domain-containing protein n=1 Tax=Meira miltonrushii TaxID=1280837 RepID=A0A316VNB1_9BASI|nr:uncharacterized protein FA14DRAFT_20646 [Meira miltonrushii]PWN37903.1 hypothetical protein FA14DRAFT_20646 [Meira miltonrushii]
MSKTGGSGGGSANRSAQNSPISQTKNLPEENSTTSHRSNTSISSTSSSNRDSHSGHGFSFFHRNSDHPHEGSALGHMLAPALSVAGAHNPFSISALNEDGTRKRTHTYGKSDKGKDQSTPPEYEEVNTDDTDSKHSRRRKRDRFRTAFGRSLSPWRYHNEDGGEGRRRSGSWNLSRQSRDSLDVQREHTDKRTAGDGNETESDGESVKSGIVPRNSAFANFADDSESEEEMGNVSRRANADSLESDGNDAAIAKNDEQTEGETESTTDAEDSDDYIDFDEETLDNTLYNAGCIDLHDAWLKDGQSQHSHSGKDHRSHAHYGPEDYDAAWEGAGPSGHDEGDEGLRAPNVVVGQDQSLSPSALTGEGMEILTIADEPLHSATGPPKMLTPSMRTQSYTSSISPSEQQSLSSISKEGASKQENGENVSSDRKLTASRPVFEKNRCTITLIHGDYDKFAHESKRPRRYIAASDGSEESSYAIEWTIGTVLRDGDEMLIVSVMETDTKLDATDSKHEDKKAHQEHQRIRQSMAVILARRAVAVLQRTRLAVRVSCQALHARNSRHMFIDMIDFFEPTMCVVGSRGLGSLKGVLLGSFSHYCVQKSPVPVMVARKRLKLPPLPKGKTDVVSNVRARHMRLDQAMIEKDANVAEDTPEKKESEKEGEKEEQTAKTNKDEVVKKEEEKEEAAVKTNSESSTDIDTPANAGDAAAKKDSDEDKYSGVTKGSDVQAADDDKGNLGKFKREEEDKRQTEEMQKDAKEASALLDEKKGAKKGEKKTDASSVQRSNSDSRQVRGRKKFTVGSQPEDEKSDQEEEPRGRSRSRSRN